MINSKYHYCLICNGYTKHKAIYKIFRRCFYWDCKTCKTREYWFKSTDNFGMIANIRFARNINKNKQPMKQEFDF